MAHQSTTARCPAPVFQHDHKHIARNFAMEGPAPASHPLSCSAGIPATTHILTRCSAHLYVRRPKCSANIVTPVLDHVSRHARSSGGESSDGWWPSWALSAGRGPVGGDGTIAAAAGGRWDGTLAGQKTCRIRVSRLVVHVSAFKYVVFGCESRCVSEKEGV